MRKKDIREEYIIGGATLPPSGSSLKAYRVEEAAGQRRPSPLCGRHTLKKRRAALWAPLILPFAPLGKRPPPRSSPPFPASPAHVAHSAPIYEWLDDAKCTDNVQCKSFSLVHVQFRCFAVHIFPQQLHSSTLFTKRPSEEERKKPRRRKRDGERGERIKGACAGAPRLVSPPSLPFCAFVATKENARLLRLLLLLLRRRRRRGGPTDVRALFPLS